MDNQTVYPSRRLYTTQKNGIVAVKDHKTHEAVLVLTLAAAEDLSEELELQAEHGRHDAKVD